MEDKRRLEFFASHELKAIDVLELMGFGVIIVDEDDKIIVYVNPTVLKMCGYKSSDVIGERCHKLVCPAEVGACPITDLKQIVDKSVRKLVRADGTTIPIIKTAVRTKSCGRNYLIESIVDNSEQSELKMEMERKVQQLLQSQIQTIEVLASTSEVRDPYTAGHQKRVAQLSLAIGRDLSLDENQLLGLQMAALVHDIGKISVPGEILSKPGKLSDLERQLIQTHSTTGYEILKEVRLPWDVADAVWQHHERCDGSGYPRGLKNDEILFKARIIAVADVVEAMVSHRPYRPALGIEEALEEIHRGSSKLYDCEIVDACLRVFRNNGFSF